MADALVELGKSRPVAYALFKARYKRYWRGKKADFTLGAQGWTATTGTALPVIGDAAATLTGSASWGPFYCIAVDVDPRVTPNCGVAVAVYESDRIWEE